MESGRTAPARARARAGAGVHVRGTACDHAAWPTIRSSLRPSSTAKNTEPRFVFEDAEAAADARLAAYGRKPNVLIVLFDDVGWGDFGCYGGGVAVGAPTPNIDRLARQRPAADVVLLASRRARRRARR